MGHVNNHVQGHISGVFRPYPLPTGTADTGDVPATAVTWGDGTVLTWGDGTYVEWSST